MTFVLILVGCLAGGLGLYLILRPKIKTTEEMDWKTASQNERLRTETQNLANQLITLESQRTALQDNIDGLVAQINKLSDNYKDMAEATDKAADEMYQLKVEMAEAKAAEAEQDIQRKYEKAKQEAEDEYHLTLEDLSQDVQNLINQKQEELVKIQAEYQQVAESLVQAGSSYESFTNALKLLQAKEDEKDFYRLQLSQLDLEEIDKLRSILPYLRDSEPLNKVIWKVYYEKPYTDLIGRIIGQGTHTGIYKITHIDSGKCYVGQAVNIADRWRQHIKRGLGAETPTRNKLYPAMAEYGVENFTFEIVEECPREELNEREDYWQDMYHAKDYGYSIK